MADVTQKAQRYLGTDNREDQDSDMIFNCLRKSITDSVYALVTTEPERYTFVTKKFRGKTYNWCPNHQLWCFHKASECKLKQGDTKETKGKKGKFSKQQLRMKAYQSLFESTSEEEVEQQEESSQGGHETDSSNTSE